MLKLSLSEKYYMFLINFKLFYEYITFCVFCFVVGVLTH